MKSKMALMMCGALALSGCVGLGLDEDSGDVPESMEAKARAAAQEPPTYRPGDRFTFDNPVETWTVSAVDGERVTWVSDTGDQQVTTRNPLLPALEWRSASRGEGRRLISGQTGAMFPLSGGETVSFRATVDTDQPPYAWEFEWTCEIGGLDVTSVPAGEFATYRVACGRGDVEETVMFYAPEVGYNTRMLVASADGGPPTERRLTSFARAGQVMSSAAPVPSTGSVRVEEETESDLPMAIADDSEDGPTALGMIADPSAPSGAVPAPEETPESGLSDGTGRSSAAVSSGAASAEGIAVHLASYKNPDNAEAGWKQLMTENRDVLDGTRPVVRQVDIPGKGLFYRLHAGPLASKSAGEEMCRTLSRRGIYCKVVSVQSR